MSTLITVTPSEVMNRSDATPLYPIGGIFVSNDGSVYRYVKYIYHVLDSMEGRLLFFDSSSFGRDGIVVTQGLDYSAGGRNAIAGVCLCNNIVSSTYTFILVRGVYTLRTNGADNIVKNDFLICANGHGLVERSAPGTAPTYRVIGIALEDDYDPGNTVRAYVDTMSFL